MDEIEVVDDEFYSSKRQEETSPYLQKRKDEVIESIFLETKCHENIKNTNCHPQMRDALRFKQNLIYFCSDCKLSQLNVDDGTVVDDIIPQPYQKNREISAFKLTKNYLLWSFEYSNTLCAQNLRNGKVFSIPSISINSIDVFEDESRAVVVGQTRKVVFYELASDGFVEMKELEQRCRSAGNFVSISRNQLFICYVTDSKGFTVLKHFRSRNFEDLAVLFREVEEQIEEENGRTRYQYREACDMCDWSCDSTTLVVASGSNVKIFNVVSKSIVAEVKCSMTSFVRFSPVLPDVFCVCNTGDSAFLIKYDRSHPVEEKRIVKYSILPHFEMFLKKRNRVSVVSMDFSENGDRVFLSYNREGILEGELVPGPLRKIGDVGRFQKMIRANVTYRDVLVVVDDETL